MRRTILTIIALSLFVSINAQNKPYITKVYDYMPAPGQSINIQPVYNSGEPKDSVIVRAERNICGEMIIEEVELPNGTFLNDTIIEVAPGLVSLGSYGGYIIFGFDHPVVNVNNHNDFAIICNASNYNARDFYTIYPGGGGGSEPGIVMVSTDVNHNGLPDDPWYEIAGSEHNNPKTQSNFTITYYKPDENKIPERDSINLVLDKRYIRWTSNDVMQDSTEGYLSKSIFRNQSYWPNWLPDSITSLTFNGTKLRNNTIVSISNNGYIGTSQFPFDWGYVDNKYNYNYWQLSSIVTEEECDNGINLDWAIDEYGYPVVIKIVDFIKVYSATIQTINNFQGEVSTDIGGAIDFHPNVVSPTILIGDANDDGSINSADISTLYDFLLGDHPQPFCPSQADINGDGIINSADISGLYDILIN